MQLFKIRPLKSTSFMSGSKRVGLPNFTKIFQKLLAIGSLNIKIHGQTSLRSFSELMDVMKGGYILSRSGYFTRPLHKLNIPCTPNGVGYKKSFQNKFLSFSKFEKYYVDQKIRCTPRLPTFFAILETVTEVIQSVSRP